MRTQSADTLADIWIRFEREVQKQHKKLPEILFDELLTTKVGHHGKRFVLSSEDGATVFATPSAPSESSLVTFE